MLLFKRSLGFTFLIFSVHLIFEYINKQTFSKTFLIEEAIDSIIEGAMFFTFLFLVNKLNKNSK
jgi:hypothetical protein